ncbi:MAG: alpha/beta fold hydrolase [Rhizonema sp. PD37]|nr:alpha/beta fold hydrolase [Rhizonema sp. PD37]
MKKSCITHKQQEKRLWRKTKFIATIGLSTASIVTLSIAFTNKISVAQSADFLTKQLTAPPGANDPNCRPNAAHPEPVILVHGTAVTSLDWSALSPLLASKGYCVYALNYGNHGTGPIENSAQELKVFVDNVLALTGASKVSIVGHSQGGMMPRYYIKFLGGADKVDDLIALSPSNYGSTLPTLFDSLICLRPDLSTGPGCLEQKQGSDFLNNLNAGDDAPGPVSYTVIATKTDEVVTPYTNCFLRTGPGQIKNITLQDYFPQDLTEHTFINKDPNAFKFVYDALAKAGPADPQRAMSSF